MVNANETEVTDTDKLDVMCDFYGILKVLIGKHQDMEFDSPTDDRKRLIAIRDFIGSRVDIEMIVNP